MANYNIRQLRKHRSEPEKIIDVIRDIEKNRGSGTQRLVHMFGYGKSQGGLCCMEKNDLFLAYQHETAWDKYEDYQELMASGIKPSPDPYFICSWNKALGIKSAGNTLKSIQLMKKSKVPDRFTNLWSNSNIRQLRKDTIKKGSEYAKKKHSNTDFYEEWSNQFDAEELTEKAIFSTVSMVTYNKFLSQELDSQRVFVDEGVAGKVNGSSYSDARELWSSFAKTRQRKLNTKNRSPHSRYSRKSVSPAATIQHKKITRWKEITDNKKQADIIGSSSRKTPGAMEKAIGWLQNIQEAIERSEGKIIDIEDDRTGDVYEIGYFDWSDVDFLHKQSASFSRFWKIANRESHKSQYEKEVRQNDKYREELIGLRNAIRWIERTKETGIAYKKKNGDLVEMMAPEHQYDRLKDVAHDVLLLNATWSPLWDKEKGINPTVLGKDKSVRELDLSNYKANLFQVKKNEEKNSISKDSLTRQKGRYLAEMLSETDWLKVCPEDLKGHLDTANTFNHTEITGKNLSNYQKQIIFSLNRLSPRDIVWNYVKEFKEIPSHPQNPDNRWTLRNSLQGYHPEDLQAMWEVYVEARVVDSMFRIARSPDDKGRIWMLGEITQGMRFNWFGNLDISGTKTLDEFIDKVACHDIGPDKAIDICQNPGIIRDREWTSNKMNNMTPDLDWAITQKLKWTKPGNEISAKDIETLTGREYDSCYSALQRCSDEIKVRGKELEKVKGGWKVTA